MDANLLRNWLRTIEKESPPFVARSPTLADTNPSSISREIAERQAIVYGSQYLGRGLQVLGTSMMAYGSTTTPRGRNSVVMRRGSDGKQQWRGSYSHDGVKYDRPAPRGNKWSGYETKPNSKAGTKAPSSRTSQRSPTLVNSGLVLTVAGRVIPAMGLIYAYYRYFGDPSKSAPEQFAAAGQNQHDMTGDIFRDIASAPSTPYGKIATAVAINTVLPAWFS